MLLLGARFGGFLPMVAPFASAGVASAGAALTVGDVQSSLLGQALQSAELDAVLERVADVPVLYIAASSSLSGGLLQWLSRPRI
ncbi:MAG: hypothetical protein FJZ92_11790 [Chloroflexi bacterium]|nr:hypothetical protein [Chloroflexota bacterium]